MDKFIPFEKLSKKKKRALNAARRGTWGAINPVTRKPKNPKAYDRQKTRRNSRNDCDGAPYFLVLHGILWDGQMSVKAVSSRGRRNADRGDPSPRQCVNGIAQGTDCRAP